MKRLLRITLAVLAALPTTLVAEAQEPESSAPTENKIHYQPELDFGICTNFNFFPASSVEIRTVQGLGILPQFQAGIGIGGSLSCFGVGIPTTLNLKYIFLPEKTLKPFVGADLGYQFMFDSEGYNKYSSGPLGEIGVGLRYRKFQCSLAYAMHFFNYDDSSFPFSTGNSLTIRVGVCF